MLTTALGEESRSDPGLIADVASEPEPLVGCSVVTRGTALFHLWRALEARLTAWISGAHRAVLAALMALDRLSQWQVRAEAETADLSGRTPLRLIAALAAHPMLAAPQAEAATGASRAAVQRNLDVLRTRQLIREVTGHGRFRVWGGEDLNRIVVGF